MDRTNHLSRHFLGTQPDILRSIPFAPPGPPYEDGAALKHRLLALADWNEDSQQNRLSIADLQVQDSGGNISGATIQELASWVTDGEIRALEVGDLGGGDVTLVAGSSNGHLSRLRLSIPLAPGSDPSEVQLVGEGDMEGANLLPWQQLHSGPVAALDASPITRELVSAGEDGALYVLPLEASPSASVQPLAAARPSASYRAVRWSSHQIFIAAGTTGGLECWDKRQGGVPQLRSPLAWGHTGCGEVDAAQGLGRQINCLAVHPSRPHLCATGSSSGMVAVWDLRFAARPSVHVALKHGAGEVWEVHFDRYEPFAEVVSSPNPPVLYCTSGGMLGAVSSSGNKPEGGPTAGLGGPQQLQGSSLLYQEPGSGINSFNIESASGQEIFCATDQECLVYLSRGSGS